MTAAEAIVAGLRLWLWAGGLVALAFVTFGIDRIDEDARGAYPFRVLLVPGVLMIWPLVLWRWAVLAAGRDDPQARHRPPRAAHAWIAPILLAAVAALLATGLAIKPDWPDDAPAMRLTEARQ